MNLFAFCMQRKRKKQKKKQQQQNTKGVHVSTGCASVINILSTDDGSAHLTFSLSFVIVFLFHRVFFFSLEGAESGRFIHRHLSLKLIIFRVDTLKIYSCEKNALVFRFWLRFRTLFLAVFAYLYILKEKKSWHSEACVHILER